MEHIQKVANEIVRETSKIIIGKSAQIRLLIMAILSDGHILLDDLPGVGKTTLVKTMSGVLGCGFNRVQFTPDLLPSDIIGMNIFSQKTGEFQIVQGPLMTNLFLADEINRAIPRTQSALLEAMEERQVTIDAQTFPIPAPFLIMATQNPIEMESTFQLPAAQMDRFLVRLSLGYPAHDDEIQMLLTVGDEIPFDSLRAVTDPSGIAAMQAQVREVHMEQSVLEYIVALVRATREHPMVQVGAGPRGSRSLYRASKSWAAMQGRSYVTPDDVKELAPHILCHRLILGTEARLAKQSAQDIISAILQDIPSPPNKEEILRGKHE